MTEATPPPTATQPGPTPQPALPPSTNVTALVGEAMTKSGVIWVEIPGDRAWPVWHAWVAPTAYVVNGPGEQHLPWLPDEVVVVLRSQDSGGRLLRVKARTQVLTDSEGDSAAWLTAVTALQAGRLNAVDDVVERWRTQCAVTALTPFGNPVEGPGHYLDGSGAATPAPTRATTARWQPWHLFGRPKRRRGTR